MQAIIFAKYTQYILRMRDKLAKGKRGFKSWWKFTNEIMQTKAQTSYIPALTVRNQRLHDSRSKANAVA